MRASNLSFAARRSSIAVQLAPRDVSLFLAKSLSVVKARYVAAEVCSWLVVMRRTDAPSSHQFC